MNKFFLPTFKRSNKNTISKLVCGFTLIEIVVVIGIMAVLTVIIYASFNNTKAQSRDQERITNISSIQLALETYYNQKHQYPTSLNLLVDNKYLSSIPNPPIGGPGGIEYLYNYVPIGTIENLCVSYHLWTKLETNNGNLSSKKGFDSTSSSVSCASTNPNDFNKTNAANDSLIYDVTP